MISFCQIMLVKYLRLPGHVKGEDESQETTLPPCDRSLVPTSVLSSPVPKTNAKAVLRYIRQKYLNANRRKNEQFHQRNLPVESKKMVPEVRQNNLERSVRL
jgi:hypothetical protein